MAEKSQMSVADLVKRLRMDRQESLRQAARGLSVDASYLSRVEAGIRSPSPELEGRMSQYYGIDRDLLELAAGRVPKDIMEIIRQHPDVLAELRKRYAK